VRITLAPICSAPAPAGSLSLKRWMMLTVLTQTLRFEANRARSTTISPHAEDDHRQSSAWHDVPGGPAPMVGSASWRIIYFVLCRRQTRRRWDILDMTGWPKNDARSRAARAGRRPSCGYWGRHHDEPWGTYRKQNHHAQCAITVCTVRTVRKPGPKMRTPSAAIAAIETSVSENLFFCGSVRQPVRARRLC
jgi:hypothetical protein